MQHVSASAAIMDQISTKEKIFRLWRGQNMLQTFDNDLQTNLASRVDTPGLCF
jgi:hypothetical protein